MKPYTFAIFAAALTAAGGCARASGNAQAAATPGIVWQAGSPTLGRWVAANSGQCGTPVQNGREFRFTLVQAGTGCGRNQANPLDRDGGMFLLAPGKTYTWTWHETDGPPPGMGRDAQAESLVWQIHGLTEPHTPCARLGFINGPDQVSAPQMWGFFTCSGSSTESTLVWSGAYVPGESDDWKITARISNGADGWVELWRNGVKQGRWTGATFHNAEQCWWNFGPYKWRWLLAGEGGSTMTTVSQTFQGMTLTLEP